MDDREHPLHKFIHIENLFQMFLTLLGHFQHTEAQEVVPEIRETRIHKQSGLCHDETSFTTTNAT